METLPRTPVQVWEFIFLYILDVKSRLNPIFYHFIYSLLFHEAHTIQGDAGLDPQFQALPRTPAQVFFNLVPGYSWCGGAVGMFFILNYYFPIDRSSSALFVAQKTEALSTWWKPLPGPLHRFFSFLFLDILDGGSELYIYFFCWKKIDDVQGLLCLVPASSMERACVRAAIGGRSWFRQCALSPHCVQFSCKHRPPPPHSFSRMRTLTNSPVVLLLLLISKLELHSIQLPWSSVHHCPLRSFWIPRADIFFFLLFFFLSFFCFDWPNKNDMKETQIRLH